MFSIRVIRSESASSVVLRERDFSLTCSGLAACILLQPLPQLGDSFGMLRLGGQVREFARIGLQVEELFALLAIVPERVTPLGGADAVAREIAAADLREGGVLD